MKRNAIARIVIYSVLLLVLVGMLLSWLNNEGFYWEQDSGNYITGGGSIDMREIENLQIEWVSGNVDVTIVPETESQITFSESNGEETPMVYEIKGKTLVIRYSKQAVNVSFGNYSGPKKDLTVEIPASWSCQSVDISAVSANVNVLLMEAGDVEIENVSGKTELWLENGGNRVSIETVSGDVSFIGQCKEFECNSVSGNCDVYLDGAAKEISLESISGDLNVSLFKEYGFTASIDSVSGKIYSDFSTTVSGGTHSYGDGKTRIDAETVSGNIYIREARIELTNA